MKLKDFVTLGNLACGFASVICVLEGLFDAGCLLIIAGYLFDATDGLVARLTKQHDRFGAELDNLCDLVTYTIAPGFLIYFAYTRFAHWPIAVSAFLGFLPLAVGTVRAARFNVRRAEYPGFFIGLPRTAFALWIVALLRSSLFSWLSPLLSGYLYLIPTALIMLACVMFVSYRPFIGHHNKKWGGWIKFGMIWFLTSIPVGIIAGLLLVGTANLVFDVLLFDLLIYVFVANLSLPKDELAKVKSYIEEWKKMA